jgi:tetratricopeptide (TPR) repeat protein
MRKLNLKLFLGLVFGAAAAAGAVVAVHAFQYQRIADALLWQARRAEDAGKIELMTHYLERYLEFAPQDGAAQARLGAALAGDHFAGSRARRYQAFVVLSKAVARNADRADLQRLLVKTALDVGEYAAARRTLEALAKAAPADAEPVSRGELEGYWGRLLEAEKKPAEAIDHYRRAAKDAPADVDAAVRLAWLLRTQEATAAERRASAAEADRAIADLVANNSTSARAHLARWRYRREFDLLDLRGGEPDKVPLDRAAAEDVDAALGQAPEDVDALVAKADSEALLETGDRVHRDRAYGYLQQGLKLVSTKGGGAANPANFELLWHLGTLLLSDPRLASDDSEMAEVEDVISRLRKTRGRPAAADYLQARLLLQKKDWAKATSLLERTRPALAAQNAHSDLLGQIDLCLGQCFAALEEWPQAEAAFKRALTWDPNSPAGRAGLGAAQRVLGKYDDALENLAQAAAASPEPGLAWLDVARLEILRQLRQDKHDWSRAEDAIDKAAHALPRDAREAVEPALLRAEIYALNNDWDNAETLLHNARKAHPDRVEFWTALADVAGRRGKEKDALAVLDEADQALHDHVELRVSRAYHIAADPSKENLDALDALIKRDHDSFTADEQDRLLTGLAEAQIRAGRPAGAAPILRELAARPERRSDLRLRLTLFDIALQYGELAEVDKTLTDIRDVEGGPGAYYELGQAMRLTRLARENPKDARADLDEAWKALDRAWALQPDWSAVELSRADVAELGGDPEGMIQHLKEVVRLEEGRSGPAVIQRLVEALNQRGRAAEAQEYLARLQQSLLADSPLAKLALGVAINTGDLTRAGQLLQASGLKDSNDYRDLLLRARLHEATGQLKEAEDDYRAAAAAEPGEPPVWVAYVFFLANHDRQADALPLVEHDVPAKVTHDRAPLTVAQCYEVLALAKDADKAYDAALAAKPNDPAVLRAVTAYRLRTGRAAEAVPLLERIAASADGDVEWARRTLALILSNSTDYRDFRRAAELVGLGIDANGILQPDDAASRAEGAEARRAKARVLATQPQRQFRARAIQLLEGLQSADPDDQFVLAMLYLGDGDDARGGDILKHIAGLPDRALLPAYLGQYVQLLLRTGTTDPAAPNRTKLDEAGRQLARLEQLEKDRGKPRGAFGTVDLRARLLEARGEGAQALDMLRDFTKRPSAAPHDALLVMGSLGRQKRFQEAFDFCEKEDLWTKCPPEAVGGVCEALLRQWPEAGGQRDRVQRWLEKAIADNPKTTVLKMHLADLADLRGDYPAAAAKYREVLEQEPGNIVALNNLAWLLAKQSGKGKEALTYIQAAVNGMGRRADLLDTRGAAELSVGDARAAVADFTEAVNDAPSAARLFHLAQAQFEAHDREAAARTLQRARNDFDLHPARLHPIEQEVCQSLLTELKIK